MCTVVPDSPTFGARLRLAAEERIGRQTQSRQAQPKREDVTGTTPLLTQFYNMLLDR